MNHRLELCQDELDSIEHTMRRFQTETDGQPVNLQLSIWIHSSSRFAVVWQAYSPDLGQSSECETGIEAINEIVSRVGDVAMLQKRVEELQRKADFLRGQIERRTK